jgi:hypothetical protein
LLSTATDDDSTRHMWRQPKTSTWVRHPSRPDFAASIDCTPAAIARVRRLFDSHIGVTRELSRAEPRVSPSCLNPDDPAPRIRCYARHPSARPGRNPRP